MHFHKEKHRNNSRTQNIRDTLNQLLQRQKDNTPIFKTETKYVRHAQFNNTCPQNYPIIQPISRSKKKLLMFSTNQKKLFIHIFFSNLSEYILQDKNCPRTQMEISPFGLFLLQQLKKEKSYAENEKL